MSEIFNDRFLRALRRQPVDRTPIWMMRQAGRYLPEYRNSRAQAGSFLDLCKNPEFALEVTLQPLERYPLDAAILFSDILTIPDAMGLGLYFETGEGPKFHKTLRTMDDVEQLPSIQIEQDLEYVVAAVKRIRTSLNNSVPLIGFSGSPWTLATYMVEGGSSKDFRHVKGLMYQQPDVMHALLDKLATAVTDYLNAQIRAGAQAVQIFDSWGGALSHRAYLQFSLPYMSKIIQGLITEQDGESIPVILFTKGGGQWLQPMADSGADALGLDWTTSLQSARAQVGDKVALQGNMDPCVLYGSDHSIRAEVAAILQEYGHGSGHVFNLGHGIQQWVEPDKVKVFIEAVQELSTAYHQQGQ